MRLATYEDIGRIAYGLLVWDAELPEHLRRIRGDAQSAQKTAEIICSPPFITWVVEEDGKIVGCAIVRDDISLMGFHPFGYVSGVFVMPKYRGHRLLGLKLINKLKEMKNELGWRWLEMHPWADAVNTGRVLERLGFFEAEHTYVLR